MWLQSPCLSGDAAIKFELMKKKMKRLMTLGLAERVCSREER
jgi:hypothetical protein